MPENQEGDCSDDSSDLDWEAILAKAKESKELAKSQVPKECDCGGAVQEGNRCSITDRMGRLCDLYSYRCVKCDKDYSISIPYYNPPK